ncbi:hypothetical protein BGZ73_002426 [Actinomortierella ambigua]|nr:hypothetical protein BGZ73_002426 [Actinomortierella ambigua]
MTDRSPTRSPQTTTSSPTTTAQSAVEALTTALMVTPTDTNATLNGSHSTVASPTTPTAIAIATTTTTKATTPATTIPASFGPPQRVRIKLHLRVGEPRSRLRQLKDLPDPPEWQHDVHEDSFEILMARIGDRVAMYPKYHWPGEGYLCIQPTKNSPQRAYEDVTRQTYRHQLLRAYAAEIKRLVLPEEVRINLFAYVDTPDMPVLALGSSSSSTSPSSPAVAAVLPPVSSKHTTTAAATALSAAAGHKALGKGRRKSGKGAHGEDGHGLSITVSSSSPYPSPSAHNHGNVRPSKRSAVIPSSSLPPSHAHRESSAMAWSSGRSRSSRGVVYHHETSKIHSQYRQQQKYQHPQQPPHPHDQQQQRGRPRRHMEEVYEDIGEQEVDLDENVEDMEGYRSESMMGEKRSPYEEEDQLEPSEYGPRYDHRYQSHHPAAAVPSTRPRSFAASTTATATEEDMDVDSSVHNGGRVHPMYQEPVDDDFREIEIEIQGARLTVKVGVASLRQALGLSSLPPPPPPPPPALSSRPAAAPTTTVASTLVNSGKEYYGAAT